MVKDIKHKASKHGKWVTICGSYCKSGVPAVELWSDVTCKKCIKINSKMYPNFYHF